MRIAVLSDTHGHIDDTTISYCATCDEVWHAGDIGGEDIISKIKEQTPIRAVFGNIDSAAVRYQYPEDTWFVCEGSTVWITHIGGKPPAYNLRVKQILQQSKPDIFICGHSHILSVQRDKVHNNMLYINPGAAGNHGFHTIKTMIRFEIENRQIRNMEAIELGKRGKL